VGVRASHTTQPCQALQKQENKQRRDPHNILLAAQYEVVIIPVPISESGRVGQPSVSVVLMRFEQSHSLRHVFSGNVNIMGPKFTADRCNYRLV